MPQPDASEFENVISSAIMQLTKTLENGFRIKASVEESHGVAVADCASIA